MVVVLLTQFFYWADASGTFESWARPIEEDSQFGEHFNFVLHRITDISSNYLFNYHISFAGDQTLSDGQDYYVFQNFDSVTQSYMVDINLPLSNNYNDSYSLAYDALYKIAYDTAKFSRPVTGGGIDLDDLGKTIQEIADSSYSMAEGGLGTTGDIFEQVTALIPW